MVRGGTGHDKRPEPVAAETELGKLAASLRPGEMERLKVKGYARNVLQSCYA